MDEKDIIIQNLQEQLIIQENEMRALAASLITALNMIPSKEILLSRNEIGMILAYQLPSFITIDDNLAIVRAEDRINA